MSLWYAFPTSAFLSLCLRVSLLVSSPSLLCVLLVSPLCTVASSPRPVNVGVSQGSCMFAINFFICHCLFWLLVTPWTVAHQAPPSMGFSRQEYWSGLPFPSPEDLPSPGIELGSATMQAGSLPSGEPPESPSLPIQSPPVPLLCDHFLQLHPQSQIHLPPS